MPAISADASSARAITRAIQESDVEDPERLVEQDSTLAHATIVDAGGYERSLLHIVTDYPGNFPNGPQTVRLLVGAGDAVDERQRQRQGVSRAAR